VFDLPSGSMLAAACVCHGSRLARQVESALRMPQAQQVRPSQVLAVAVSVMGFDYSHGRRPPSDPQCIPVASLRRVTACVSPCYAQNVTLLQVCAAVRSPASASTAASHWSAIASCAPIYSTPPGPLCRATPHSRPSLPPSVGHHHDQAETIALAGLVNPLHASRLVPRSLRYRPTRYDGSREGRL
jgi:hypothetical protein